MKYGPKGDGSLEQCQYQAARHKQRMGSTGCDAQTGCKVVQYGKDEGLQLQRHPPSLDHAVQRNANDESDVEPVNMLVPVGFGDWCLGDVLLLWIVRLVPVWL